MDVTLTLPGGETLPGSEPVVVVGPNGSGKTRQTRQLGATSGIEFINALRNTRVAPDLPAMGVDTARTNYNAQKQNSRSNHWDQSSDFDYMLSQLLAQRSMASMDFERMVRANPSVLPALPETPLHRVEDMWSKVFEGRALEWQDWKPIIRNRSTGVEQVYSGNQMSDGEKAALYLAGRVLSADSGVVVVDEPETHLHSLLAARLWDQLQSARPDVRFVFVTHDLNFAMSRQPAIFVLASPTAGLRVLDISASLPDDVAEELPGSASLSFYASRVVFTEGSNSSYDAALYGAWFNGPDTVVKPVGGSQRLLRCVDALNNSGIASGLAAIGLIDRDFHSDAFEANLPAGVEMLQVHEVESLLSIPAIVEIVCNYTSQPFEANAYSSAIVQAVSAPQQQQIIVERWKRRLEPRLEALVSGVAARDQTLEELEEDIPGIFDRSTWPFSPEDFLHEERDRVTGAIESGDTVRFLAVFPGKQMLPIAARFAGLQTPVYVQLITSQLSASKSVLGPALEHALLPYLPPRHAAVRAVPQPGV